LSKWTTDKVRSEGVRVLPNTSIKSASIDPETNKLILTTSDNQVISADHAIVAVGIEAETSLAKESNLEIDSNLGGFKVNEELEARYIHI
jgi:programmed cell death 8 (apoptosis-inducing factor)